jgi:hypothetical protein
MMIIPYLLNYLMVEPGYLTLNHIYRKAYLNNCEKLGLSSFFC